MYDTLEVLLPPRLTSTTLRRALRDSALTSHTGDVSSLQCEFKPPVTKKRIEINAKAVKEWTIEGFASLMAFYEWLVAAAGTAIEVGIVWTPLPKAPVNSRFAVPRYWPETMPETWQTGRQILFNLTPRDGDGAALPTAAEHTIRLLHSAYGDDVRSAPVTALIHEFFFEGLCNVLEHTMQDGAKPASAWLGARVYDSVTELQEILARRAEDERVDNWLSKLENPNDKVLELVIVDIGIGVAKSLADVYLREHKNSNSDLLTVHDEILRWALSAFGSRKLRDGFEDGVFARAWRGLYRVLFRASAMDGLVTLRSGVGMYGRASAGPSTWEMRMADMAEGADRRAMPWTSLHLLVPLTPRVFQPREERALQRFERIEALPFQVRKEAYETAVRRGVEAAQQSYARDVQRSVKSSHIEVEDTEPGALRKNPVIAVIHPLMMIDLPSFARPPAGKRRDRAMQYLADAAVRLLIDAALPGIIPVHIGLRIDSQTADEVQRLFAERHVTLSTEPNPQLCGVISSAGKIHWLLFIDNQGDAARLAESRILETDGPIPKWWSDLAHYYHGLFTIDEDASFHRIRFHAPDRLSTEAIIAVLAKLQVELYSWAVAEQRPWWWQADPALTEVVRTTSNRVVRQFLSINALCAEEPVFEDLLRIAARELLRDAADDGSWLIVPDSEAASFLARRLFDGAERIRVCEPESFADEFSWYEERVCLFTDASYGGTRLRDRAARIEMIAPLEHAIVCCNVSPAGSPPALRQQISLMRWPLDAPLNEKDVPADADPLSIDEMTNEILPRSTKEEVEDYALVLSSRENDVVESLDSLAQRGVIVYGLKRIDDRLHVCRCLTSKLLQSPGWRKRIIEDLVEHIRPQLYAKDCDIIFITRDESSVARYLSSMAEAVAQRLQQGGWKGRAFATTIATTRRSRRQILRHQLTGVIRSATPVRLRTVRGEVPLFSVARPRESSIVVYIDNAAITGHAINDVARAVARAEPLVSALVEYTLVNKLSPSADRMWPRLSLIERKEETPLFVHFGSLLQFRIGTFDRFEGTPLHMWLTRLARIANELSIDGGQQIALEIESITEQMADSRSDFVLQFPLGPIDAPEVRLSAVALRLRHIITSYLDGLPVLHLLVEQLRSFLRDRHREVLFVLALEPDILPDRVLSVVADDLLDLVESVLQRETDAGLRRNALLVAVQLGQHFVRRAGVICDLALSKPDTAAHFIVLLAHFIERSHRADDLLLAIRGTYNLRPELFRDRYLSVIEAAAYKGTASRPETVPAAVAQVERFLMEARGYHGSERFGAWWKLTLGLVMPAKPVEREVTALCASDLLWNEARQFLEEHIVPTIYALSLLTRDTPRAGLTQPDKVVRNAVAAFEYACQVAGRVKAEADKPEKVIDAWRQVLRATLDRTVQILYAQCGSIVTGDVPLSSVLDHALPYAVQEPVGLLLHLIEKTFGEKLNCDVIVRVMDTVSYVDYGNATRHLTVLSDKMWEGPSIFAITISGGDALRKIFKILVGNIKQHGGDAPDILANFRSNERTTTLTLRNKKNLDDDTQGQRYGLKDIEPLVSRLGATFTHSDLPTAFEAVLQFPTQLIRLPERGAQ
jgi:hypothetical protein